jgi:hypothetical protein
VGQRSHALDLEPGLFGWDDPQRIAHALLSAAQRSTQKKRTAYGSAMAMLCFYINRAGRRLSPERLAVLNQAKEDLRAWRALPPQPSTGTCTD